MKNQVTSSPKNQQGFTTLIISLLILFLITLITLYAANTTILEQKVSAVQYRTDQALAAADAGMDWGLACFDDGSGCFNTDNTDTPDFPDCIATAPCTQADIFAAGYAGPDVDVFFCGPDGIWAIQNVGDTCTPPTSTRNVGIVSIGYSDDNSAVRIIRQQLDSLEFFGEGPKSSVTSPSFIDLTGNLTVINRYFNTTIWSGDAVVSWGSAASYVRNPDANLNPNNPAHRSMLIDPDTSNDYTSLGSSKAWQETNLDVLDGDINLKKLRADPDKMFRSYFNGKSKSTIKKVAEKNEQYFVGAPPDDKIAGLSGIVYIEGKDININGIGTADKPVLLVVEGSVRVTGSGNFHGFLYVADPNPAVTGDGDGIFSGAGTAIMYGAMATEGKYDAQGNVTLVYDPEAFNQDNMQPLGARVSGTWKDW